MTVPFRLDSQGKDNLRYRRDMQRLGKFLEALNAAFVTSISIASANGISGTSSGGQTPALTLTLGAITPATVAPTAGATAATGTFTGIMTGTEPVIGANFKLVMVQLAGFTSAGGGVYTFPVSYTVAPTVADPLAGATITTTTTDVTVIGTSLSGAVLLIGA